MLTYAANTWQLFILVAIRWHCCCFVRWYWLGIHYLPGRETIPRLNFLQSTAEFCVDQGQRLRQWPQFTHSPWMSYCHRHTCQVTWCQGSCQPPTQRKCIRSGQFAFSGKDEQNANPRAALLWRPNVCSWFCFWSAALLHQHITCYLRKQICFCTMGFFALFCLSFILFVKLSFPASRASLLSRHGNALASLFTSSLKRKVLSPLQHRTCAPYVVQKILC